MGCVKEMMQDSNALRFHGTKVSHVLVSNKPVTKAYLKGANKMGSSASAIEAP